MESPTFAIGGFMKSGTTFLRNLLRQSGSMWLPNREVHLLTLDDEVVHPDFIVPMVDGSFQRPTFDPSPGSAWERWRQSVFGKASLDVDAIGEDATMYGYSSVAPGRASLLGIGKIIFVLREPTKRAWSEYWHLVRSGRVDVGIDPHVDELLGRGLVLRSSYADLLRPWFEELGSSNILLLESDDLFGRPAEVVARCQRFLGLFASQHWNQSAVRQNSGGQPHNKMIHRAIVRSLRPDLRYWALGLLPAVPGSKSPTAYNRLFYLTQSRALRVSSSNRLGKNGSFPCLDKSFVCDLVERLDDEFEFPEARRWMAAR